MDDTDDSLLLEEGKRASKPVKRKPYDSAKWKEYYARTKERQRANRKRNYALNPDRQKQQARTDYQKHRRKRLLQKAEARIAALAVDPDGVRESDALKRANADPAKRTATMREWQANRRATDPVFRVAASLRSRLGNALRLYGNGRKHADTTTLIGCTIPELVLHLEKQFEPWMSWSNYGRRKDINGHSWVIDHKRACATYDLSDPEQQALCFHFTNLAPLEYRENIRKGKRLDWTPPLKEAA
jgi:hypothetical protein